MNHCAKNLGPIVTWRGNDGRQSQTMHSGYLLDTPSGLERIWQLFLMGRGYVLYVISDPNSKTIGNTTLIAIRKNEDGLLPKKDSRDTPRRFKVDYGGKL